MPTAFPVHLLRAGLCAFYMLPYYTTPAGYAYNVRMPDLTPGYLTVRGWHAEYRQPYQQPSPSLSAGHDAFAVAMCFATGDYRKHDVTRWTGWLLGAELRLRIADLWRRDLYARMVSGAHARLARFL